MSVRQPSRWVYLLPALHLCACTVSYVGLVIPGLQYLGILFTVILLVDLPISVLSYALGWRYSAIAVIWIFVAGTLWWYLLARGAQFLIDALRRRKAVTLFPDHPTENKS